MHKSIPMLSRVVAETVVLPHHLSNLSQSPVVGCAKPSLQVYIKKLIAPSHWLLKLAVTKLLK